VPSLFSSENRGTENATIAGSFSEQVTIRPEAPAVWGLDGEQDLTYGQLHESAQRVAAGLRAAGAEPGDVVGVLLPRSVEYVVATLGVLFAGCGCLPLNPRDPNSRLAAVLAENSVSAVVVTSAEGREYDAPVLEIGQLLRGPVCDVEVPWAAEDLAFVFATSGSTGTPKSVRLSNSACATQLPWVQSTFGLTEEDVHLFKSSPSFVSVLRHIVWPLATGGSVVVLPDGRERDFRFLARTIVERRVTVAVFMPSSLRLMIEHLRKLDSCALRQVLCGGEVLDVDLQRDVFSLSHELVLHNVYGLSEAPLVAHWECDRREVELAPIGLPVPGVEIAIGDDGDLSVRGAIFDGYTGYDPRSADGWFVTGDVVGRKGKNGPLFYRGRGDNMVKVRGFRIEPGEIEAVLLRHPRVRDAIIEAQQRSNGADLVAHLIADAPPSELRDYVARALPDYMVPTRWQVLEGFPLLENGKVDRRALRRGLELTTQSTAVTSAPVAPAGEVDEDDDRLNSQIREIWEEVLGLRPIDIDQEFRSLGGDSLQAIEIALEVESLVGRELPFEVFAESPTVRALASACRAVLAEADSGDGAGSDLALEHP
jgi:acyl-CoA synthetase (AMP-forming)/AMP-acid ligase II/acyl carrier protein